MHKVNLIRQSHYHDDCEAAVNKQINMELYASYVYLSMAAHFERHDVALPGFHKFFKKNSDEERGHAQKFIEFQNNRGGSVKLTNITAPETDSWGTGLDALQKALELEKNVNQSLLDMHAIATGRNDPQMCDFIEANFLTEQTEAIKQLGDYITQLKRCGGGLGEYLFDKHTLQGED